MKILGQAIYISGMNPEPFTFESDQLDEVLQAIRDRRMAKQQISGAQLTLVSRNEPPTQIRGAMRRLQYKIRAEFGVRMVIVGGGYGCYKYIILLIGKQQDTSSAIKALKGGGPEVIDQLRAAGIDFITDSKTQNQFFLEKPSVKKASSADRQRRIDAARDRISKLRNDLVVLFGRHPSQQRNLNDYFEALDEVLDSLQPNRTPDMRVWKRFRYLGDLLGTTHSDAYGTIERIVGCVEILSAERLIE